MVWPVIWLAAACEPRPSIEPTVEIISVASTQLMPDSLEVTPQIRTVEDMPEPGLVALSLDLQLRNRRETARLALPRIGFRSWRDDADVTSSNPAWHRPAREVSRRTGIDSLAPGATFAYGLSTSALLVAPSAKDAGVYRVEAYLIDFAGAEHTVHVGRLRLRLPPAGSVP